MARYTNLDKYEGRELNSHGRAAAVTLELVQGARLTTAEIARLTQQTRQGARNLMNNLSRLPIVQDDDGRWRWFR